MYKQDGGNVYFLRHCTTPWNEEKRIQGVALGMPLNPAGLKEAGGLVAVFQDADIDEILSTDARRGTQVANLIAEAKGLKIKTWEDLREIDWGELEGKLYREVLPNHPNPQVGDIIQFLLNYDGSGETPQQREQRARRVKDKLLINPHQDKLVVFHGTFGLYVTCAVDNEPVTFRPEYILKNGHFHQYRIVDGKFILKGLNLKTPIKD